jgi:hypothetical protein
VDLIVLALLSEIKLALAALARVSGVFAPNT